MFEGAYVIDEIKAPFIPLRGMTLYPGMTTHFDVGRDKSVKAINEAMERDSIVILSTQVDGNIEDPQEEDIYNVGVSAEIKQIVKLPFGSMRVLVDVKHRVIIEDFNIDEDFMEASGEEYSCDQVESLDKEVLALRRLVESSFSEYLDYSKRVRKDVLLGLEEIEDLSLFTDTVASYMSLKAEQHQEILESFDPFERLELVYEFLEKEIELFKIEEKIASQVKEKMNEAQKEYYLKEQIQAIQEELGDGEDLNSEIDEYKEKLEEKNLPEEVEEKSLKELNRLRKLPSHSPETGIIRTYLDWIIDLPWDEATEDKLDIKRSREILDEDHYGLEEVKERILEFIAVRKLSDDIKGPILCLVGPPGVGKTSIAKSVARALNKNFVRMSLGGVRDESEIRGHRKTYVGAMPGRIIDSLKKAGSNNPLFLLDEIDKVGSDFRGDPASALLEVLDPEQNDTFTDHFLEVPFDLSNVFFLTTANSLATIPGPLLDRMEVIEISSYTQEEKFKIAERYLIPKQMKENGLKEESLQISDSALKSIIKDYTREAGVRNLEREIGKICRKAAIRIVEEEIDTVRVTISNLHNFLGIKKYPEVEHSLNEVGVATGLAWTAVGGQTLSIEVNKMKGKGKVQLTGKLGDVMKESALAGLSYIRANAEELGIDEDFHEKVDLHIHVPEGATPKDGPSAGITMATACVSVLSNRKIDEGIAMTGEITLRGRVLPVGGIKEKVLAANRKGIKKIIIPKENEKDLEEIPANILRDLDIRLVNKFDEVLDMVLLEKGED